MKGTGMALKMLRGFMVLGMIGLSSLAQANSQGEAILRVSDLLLTNGSGNSYSAADFSSLSTSSILHVNAVTRYSSDLGGDVDLWTMCSIGLDGKTCNPRMANYFEPFSGSGYSFYADTYRNSDQKTTGQLFGENAGPMSIDTRGDLGIYYVESNRSFVSSSTADLTMTFKMASADQLTLSFNADAYATAWHYNLGQWHSDITSQVKFEAKLVNATTGVPVFTYAPDELNFALSPENTTLLENPASQAFSISSGLLNTSDEYILTISQVAMSSGAAIVAVPEPATIGMLAAGLAVLGMARRTSRKNRTRLAMA